MQNTTADYKLEINKPSRSFECKVTIGDNIYKNEDIVDIILEHPQPQEGFSIGSTVSQTLDLTLINKGDTIYSTSQVKVEIGLKIGSTIEYIPMGIFNIDDIEKTDYTTKFTCYDNMIKFETAYFSSLGDKPTLQQVVNELSSKTGVQFTGNLPAYTVSKLDGFSCREVLSYVASICGGNALITRDGKFTIKSLVEVEKSIDANNYFEYKREEVKYKIGKISCQVDENNILSKGSIGIDSMELQFENPWVNQTILTDIYNKLNGLSYLGYSMKWQGDLSLDPYDIITVTDVKNITRKIPILSRKLTYTGGLTSEIGAKGETKNKNSFSSSGSTTNKVNRLVTEQAIIKQALIEKANISDLVATNAEIANLKVKHAEIEEAIIGVAHIEDLTAINASIANLIAADANITNLIATKADITDLTATNIKFNVGSGGTLDLQTLLSKFITGENGQFLNITSSNVVIANAVIKDAMIENISVNKLLAGTISTNKFTVASDDGGITIVGPTMQFKDKNNKVRIQMGQDTQGNFNFILRGEDGTTTLIDHTGIKEKAIADDLIKSNMVAEDAIGEKQINYSSLVTGLNKDTNTQLIKASKVAIDLTGQSLEVAFNTLKTNVDNTQIGGRNYIRDYQFKSETIWGKSRTEAKVDVINGYGYLTSSTANPYLYQELKHADIKNGDTLTLQYEIKFENVGANTGSDTFIIRSILTAYLNGIGLKGDVCTFGRHESDGLYTNDGWQKVVKTLTINTELEFDFLRFRLYARNFTGAIYFRNVKLEKGNKATDLSEAPEDASEKIEANTTSISAIQGSIETLIKNTTIEKDGTTTTLKDAYSSLKQTVDGINTTVSSHTTSISNINSNVDNAQSLADSKAKVFTSTPTTPYKVGDLWVQGANGDLMKCKVARSSGSYTASDWEKASKYTDDTKANSVEGSLNILSGTVTTVSNKQASLEQSLNGFKTTVSSTYSTKIEVSNLSGTVTSLTTRVSTAESSITQLNNQIKLKVEATDITTAINNINIGGRNLAFSDTIKLLSSTSTIDKTDYTKKGNITVSKATGDENGGFYFDKAIKYKKNTQYIVHFKMTCTNNTIENIYFYNGQGLVSTKIYIDDVYVGIIGSVINTSAFDDGIAHKVRMEYITPSTLVDSSVGVNQTYFQPNKKLANNPYTILIEEFMVEEGNKISAWTEPLEDINSDITTVENKVTTTSNKVATIETNLNSITQTVSSHTSTISTHTTQLGTVDSRINTAKNAAIDSSVKYTDGEITTVNQTISDKVADIKITTDSIKSRVSSTEQSISTINGNISSLQTRISNAEQKITDSAIISTVQSTINQAKTDAINSANTNTANQLKNYSTTTQMNTAITQSANSIKSEVSNSYLSKSDATNTYATKSSLTQTSDSIIAKFEETGGYNLIRNSTGLGGTNNWRKTADATLGIGRNTTALSTATYMYLEGLSDTTTRFAYSSRFKLQAGQQYSFSSMIHNFTKCSGFAVQLLMSTSVDETDTGVTYTNSATLVAKTTTNGAWQEFKKTITIPTGVISGYVRVVHYGYNSAGSGSNRVNWSAMQFEEGSSCSKWSPHPDEIYSGSTVIDANGVTINNGALTVKNKAGTTVLQGDSNGNLKLSIFNSVFEMSATGTRKTQMTCDVLDKFHLKVPFENSGAGFKLETDTGKTFIEATAGTDYLSIPIWTKISTLSVNGDTYVAGNFSVGGSKNSLQSTQNYGERLINAYETAEYYFGDIGSGVIKNGECLIYIDDILQECINTDCEYHVFTQVYSGSITKIERYKNYFIIYGENNTEFSWELKAKRLGYENVRLDVPEIEMNNEDYIIEDILNKELDFKLEDILLEEVA